MPDTLERLLQAYAELTVRVGLNVQKGQRLIIIGPLASGGVSLEAAPLVRHIAASAYRAGSPLVEAVWGDEPLQLVRFRHARPETFSEFFDLVAEGPRSNMSKAGTPCSQSTPTIRIC